MKPVEHVSIGGYVFSLEEDACAAARKYLEELGSFYSKVESGAEVMEGIEERMSELLLEKAGQGSIECVEYPELGMEAIWKIRVEDFPAFILVDDKGNDFFKKLGL